MKFLPILLVLFCGTAWAQTGTASYYSTEACQFNPDPKCPTASGRSLYDLEKNGENFAAIWNVAFGTKLKVCNTSNQRCVVVTVRDRGPNKRLNRAIDLSKTAFEKIADTKQGIINVMVERL